MGILDTAGDSIIKNAYKRIFDKKSAADQHEAFKENLIKVCNEMAASRKIKLLKIEDNLSKSVDTKTKLMFQFAEGSDKYLEITAMSGGIKYMTKILLIAHGDRIEKVVKLVQEHLNEMFSPFGTFKNKGWTDIVENDEEPEKKAKK